MITVLAGGTGSVKIVRGLASGSNENLNIISNVGDNIWLYGLYICPDIDTVLYGLAGILSKRGWGIKNDSFNFLDQMNKLQQDVWFKLGDRDIATHLFRTALIKKGKSLTEVTDWIAKKLSVSEKILPATNEQLQTIIVTDEGPMHIQEFWVKYKGNPRVRDVQYIGAESSTPDPNLLNSLKNSESIIIAPANPISSISPILQVKGIRELLKKLRKRVTAISPLKGEQAISGPAVKYMKAMNVTNSPVGVAEFYSDIIGNFIIDSCDSIISSKIARLDINVFKTDIIMRNRRDEMRLASYIKSLKS
ncbi:MAG: 2-phospho-L-lactate transferase [Thermoproteota archaeon]|nr:2-phospho-L-lactate transferase [Thermoproteota archaeon]